MAVVVPSLLVCEAVVVKKRAMSVLVWPLAL